MSIRIKINYAPTASSIKGFSTLLLNQTLAMKAITQRIPQIVAEEKVFHKTWVEGQSVWPPLSDEWVREKMWAGLMPQIWTATGETLKDLSSGMRSTNHAVWDINSSGGELSECILRWGPAAIAKEAPSNNSVRPWAQPGAFGGAMTKVCNKVIEEFVSMILKKRKKK